MTFCFYFYCLYISRNYNFQAKANYCPHLIIFPSVIINLTLISTWKQQKFKKRLDHSSEQAKIYSFRIRRNWKLLPSNEFVISRDFSSLDISCCFCFLRKEHFIRHEKHRKSFSRYNKGTRCFSTASTSYASVLFVKFFEQINFFRFVFYKFNTHNKTWHPICCDGKGKEV